MSQGRLFVPPPNVKAEADHQETLRVVAAGIRPPPQPAWVGSPFFHFKARSPTVTGAMFETLIERFLLAYGHDVLPRTSSGHDRIVDGLLVEIKGATLTPTGIFVFNQIRDQRYDLVFLLGLTPTRAYLWVETKATARELGRNQHASLEGTRWLHIDPDWIGPASDGTLSSALRALTGPRLLTLARRDRPTDSRRGALQDP